MAERPNNLTPEQNGLRPPDDNQKRYGNLINGPRIPEFGGAEAVNKIVKRAPYGRITHVGRRGKP